VTTARHCSNGGPGSTGCEPVNAGRRATERIARNFGVRGRVRALKAVPRLRDRSHSEKSAEICGKQRLIGFAFIDRDDFEIVAHGF
jgi:hypothetical protein